MTNGEIIIKGTAGTSASLGAWWIAHVEQLNSSLQTVSLGIGIAVGLVSLVKLLKKRNTKKKTD